MGFDWATFLAVIGGMALAGFFACLIGVVGLIIAIDVFNG